MNFNELHDKVQNNCVEINLLTEKDVKMLFQLIKTNCDYVINIFNQLLSEGKHSEAIYKNLIKIQYNNINFNKYNFIKLENILLKNKSTVNYFIEHHYNYNEQIQNNIFNHIHEHYKNYSNVLSINNIITIFRINSDHNIKKIITNLPIDKFIELIDNVEEDLVYKALKLYNPRDLKIVIDKVLYRYINSRLESSMYYNPERCMEIINCIIFNYDNEMPSKDLNYNYTNIIHYKLCLYRLSRFKKIDLLVIILANLGLRSIKNDLDIEIFKEI